MVKLNCTLKAIPVTWHEICQPYLLVPTKQMEGYYEMFVDMKKDLEDITGFHIGKLYTVPLQINFGAQGEHADLWRKDELYKGNLSAIIIPLRKMTKMCTGHTFGFGNHDEQTQ